jgi:hypothetical protein
MYIGFVSLYSVLVGVSPEGVSPAPTFGLLTAIFGYFIHDFWALRHNWLKYPVDIVHHLAAFAICIGVLFSIKVAMNTVPYVPYFGTVELSTVLLDVSWMMRETGNAGHFLFKPLQLAFAATFFATRIVLLPYLTFVVSPRERFFEHGLLRAVAAGLAVACVLQVYWFIKIVKMVTGSGGSGGGGAAAKDKKKK